MFQYYTRSFSRLGVSDSCGKKKKLANVFLERNLSKIVMNSIWPGCSIKLMFSDAEISMKYFGQVLAIFLFPLHKLIFVLPLENSII